MKLKKIKNYLMSILVMGLAVFTMTTVPGPTDVTEPASALRPHMPCQVDPDAPLMVRQVYCAPSTTTTTTPLPPARPVYDEANPLVVGCAGSGPWRVPVENWSAIYDVRNGDYVDLCGTVYLYTGDETTVTPGNCLGATIATDLNRGQTYTPKHKFRPTADSEFQGDVERLRMRVFDAYGNRVQTQNRWEENNHWGKSENFGKPFRFKRRLAPGTYTVEIKAWFYEKADGCGPVIWGETVVIAIG